jgi:alkyl hydroperoxide reductase subunit F
LKYEQKNEEKKLDVQGVFVEIGRIPNTDFVKDFLKLDDHQHIEIDCTGHTSVEGVFAAGDCASGHEYQYVIAAGQGCMCLLKAARYLAWKK